MRKKKSIHPCLWVWNVMLFVIAGTDKTVIIVPRLVAAQPKTIATTEVSVSFPPTAEAG
jgi:hypothetical protein